MRDLSRFARKLRVEDSSNIVSIFFAPKDHEMVIEFKNRKFYHYFDVDPDIFGSLASGESVGALFNKLVQANDKIPFEEMPL